ncbi:MAG: tyrosine recombinase [Rhodospirillales bacterium]|jgi:integrase/recombinase XerD|nr:tyrosine recombinase [Rhodospirillales bacterium]
MASADQDVTALSAMGEIFLEMMAAERGAAANTVDSYRRDLHDFTRFMVTRRRAIEDADARLLRLYLERLSRGGMTPATIARRLSALAQFFGFLVADGRRDDDPMSTLDRPRQSRGLPKPLSEPEVTSLLTAAHRREDAKGLRLAALVEILYATGLRATELISLPLSAVARDAETLVVTGKGGKERMVPLTEEARAATAAYLGVRDRFLTAHAAGPANRWLFPSRSRQGHLTRVRFSQLLKDLARDAGLDARKVSPHVLRHSFASHLLANGADLRSLQQMMGHADIATTQIYTRVLDERLVELVETAHPLAASNARDQD